MTPKAGESAPRPSTRKPSDAGPTPSSRYTPPVPSDYYESPRWIPVLMFVLFAIGILVIFLHYVDLLLPGGSSNWWLFAGLAAILGGIITATQYR